MHKSYADTLESYMIEPAEEGVGTEILKFVGKGALKILGKIGIFLAINIGICSLVISKVVRDEKKCKERLANMTPEEKLSRKNYLDTWVPKIQEFQKSVAKDIDKFDKKNDIKKFLYEESILPDTPSKEKGYGAYIAGIEYSTIQFPDADGDDEPDPDKAKEFTMKLRELKPLIQKWKNEARIFSPYFELMISAEDENEDYPWFEICLSCKWIDRYGIIKPGLPKFGEK